MRRTRIILLLIATVTIGSVRSLATGDVLVRDALAAEAKLDTRRALELFLDAEKLRPDDPLILRKIARQYSDLTVDLADAAEKRRAVERALNYSRRAVALEPGNAENVLSVAICYGKIAVQSGASDKVKYSRLVHDETERAIALDPAYAWAHHVLGRWNYEVATLGSTTRMFVRIFYGGLPVASTPGAVRHLERAVELEPNQLQHRLELGFAYLADGQLEKARASFAAGLAMPSLEKHDEPAKARARTALAGIKRG